MVAADTSLIKTTEIENLILQLIANETTPIEIDKLFSNAENLNSLAVYEFKYALSHLLANQIIYLDSDGKISIR